MAKTGTGKYGPVVEELRELIGSGALPAGEWLPSEAQLMDQHGISRYSAREAIKKLAGEGLIVVVDGKGSYVRARRDRASHADPRAIWHTTAQAGRGVYRDAESARWTSVEKPGTYRTNAGVDLALALAVPEHTPLFVYDRLLTEADTGRRPSTTARRMVHRLYLPMSTCVRVPALADDPFRSPDELYAALTAAGIEPTWTEHVRATAPAPDDTTSLHLAPGAAVLITRRVTTDPDGRALAMEETRRSAEDTQLTYTITPTRPPADQAG